MQVTNNQDATFLQFAWDSLTTQQQFRINMKYELSQSIGTDKCKRNTYRAIGNKYGYSMERVERIAVTEL